jgi:hypothetical protein
LIERGYKRVRPLRGGAEAWTEAGFALARIDVLEQPDAEANSGGQSAPKSVSI